jgi:hypothetical protein
MSASSGRAPAAKHRGIASDAYQRPESLDEAASWLTTTLSGQRIPKLLLTIGFGNGHLLDVLEQCDSQARVLALEPDPKSAARFLVRRDWAAWRDSGRLRLLVGPGYEGADEAWRAFPAMVDDCAMLVHPHLLQGPATADAVRVAQGIVAGARANAAARRKFAPRYLTNVLRNVPAIVDGHDVQALSDAYRGVPAIVAAAGPSLDSALPALADLRDRAVLFAVDTALRPCLTAGITPQFVVGADPSTANARHFQWLPECANTWLIAESALDRSATQVFDGRTLFFRVSRHHPWPWLQQWGCDAGQIDMWGSVLTAGFGAAVLAGCDPIIFAGADLAFTAGQPYARGTTYEFDWACGEALGVALHDWWKTQTQRAESRTEPDLRGRDTMTTTSMVSFRDWLAARMQRSGRRVINATGGGILRGAGVIPGTIAEALATAPAHHDLDPTTRLRIDHTGSPGKGIDRERLRDTATRAITSAVAMLVQGSGPSDPSGALLDPTTMSPIPDWREFSGDGFDPNVIGAALQHACDELARRATVPPGHWTSTAVHAPALDTALMHALPEGVRRWRLLRSADSNPNSEGTAALPASIARADADRGRLLVDALALLNWIRLQAANGAGNDQELAAWAAEDGASWQAIPEPMRWGVALFDASLGHATSHSLPAPPADLPRCEDVAVAVTQRRDAVTLAVMKRLRRWVDCVATLHESSRAVRDASARLMLLERALRAPRHQDGESVNVVVTAAVSSSEPARVVIPLDRSAIAHLCMGMIRETMRSVSAGTGNAVPSVSLAVRDGDADLDALHVPVAIRPQLIPQQGSPRSIVAYGVRDGVVCVRFHDTDSTVVRSDGTLRVHHHWPRGIIGELPFGTTGAVAWGNGRSDPDRITPGYVMYRHYAEDDVIVEELPFRPVRGNWCGDRLFWSCLPSGVGGWTGIASWAPGGEARQELGAITIFDIHRQADGALILEPCTRHADDSIERRLATMAWRWQPGSTLQPFPLDSLGASSHRAESPAWAAVAYPHADAIRMTSARGTVFTMVCPSPFRLAWADGDLIVSTLSLELWRFPRMTEVLDGLGGLNMRTPRE